MWINAIILLPITSAVDNPGHENIPRHMQLFPIYPNPINQEAVVSFRLTSYQTISLRIYDMLGNEVSTLAQGKLSAGKHEIVWNGTDLTSGIYFVTLSLGNFQQAQKMILIK